MATGFPLVIPLAFEPNAPNIEAAFFSHWFSLLGAPHCLVADNATEFSLLFDILKSEFGTII